MTNPALAEDVPFPGMPTPPTLWAVHVQGADEIHPFLDKAEAEKLVAYLGARDTEERNKGKERSVYFHAKLIEWPGTRDEFAEAMREESAFA